MATSLDLKSSYVQIVNGQSAPTATTRHGLNPANGQALPEVPVATEADLDRAVQCAKAAFRGWSTTPYEQRRRAVLAFADAIEENYTGFRELLTLEQGKPIPQATAEMDNTISWMRGMADLQLPEEVAHDDDSHTVITRYVPLGVVGAIVPWNFPMMLATGKIAPALLTGNVIIVKPSPFTPYGGLKLVELAQSFFPPGVVQSLSGDDSLGPWMTSHPGLDKISFTGSTATGKRVLRSASDTLKRVTLELGGNDPAIVFPDVDVARTAEKIAFFAFLNSGQICLNIKRIYVHKSIFEEFKAALVRAVNAFSLGDGSQPGITHGPLQNEMQYSRVKTFFDEIKTEGWQVCVGGAIDQPSTGGYFLPPTIIDRPPDSSRIVVDEPFGPIVPLLSWEEESEVIERANNSLLGLGASVWTEDLTRAARVARQLEAGTVWTNNHFALSPAIPFSGHKESGLSVEWGLVCNVQSLFLHKKHA
ncbi:aldehyde dehydrogenase family protein [Aspergillus brunneoviolaceus CBS 621.78]|uniref:Aldehyde dehydrogenase n=1 Tax=Aspergillus brunneoviolaceus CBS 621.78 TaxID=1450534 RepID=A0ACD1GBI9_9EURO|nr:aldehyde dehydrogenase [Aspergillus brunneoviolaceus CBS 621.78]RAH46665.1 aldehyde dehydrogenase [Aspergillus brunneoviolaceus CBS 621.78]